MYLGVDIRGGANEAVASQLLFQRSRAGPLSRVLHLVFALFVKKLITLQSHLISSEGSNMFVKIKQNLCANVPKRVPQQRECVDKQQLKTK